MKPAEILLVEDNPADAMLLTEALELSGWEHRLVWVKDGAAALAYLLTPKEPHAPRPDLILLDLNLPILNGQEVLARTRVNPWVARIPVFLLSGSEWEHGSLAALGLPEGRYLVKPMTFGGYLDIVQRIRSLYEALAFQVY